jgi:uracil-DNA glycosylase
MAGYEVGTYGIQPRIRHLFDRLGLDLRDLPASNVIFVRTRDEASLAAAKQSLLDECWPVHKTIIDMLGIRTVICLGGTAGRWVQSLLGAHQLVGRFVETNSRRWTSEAHVSAKGTRVLTLTHPGRADWRNPNADPTPLVRDMIEF